jgi:hypothetical protein
MRRTTFARASTCSSGVQTTSGMPLEVYEGGAATPLT